MLDMAWARGSDAIDRAASDLLQCLTLAMIVGMGRSALRGAPGAVMVCFAAMLLVRRSVRPAVATAALCAVEIAVYLHGYRGVSNPDHTGLADGATNLWACMSYMLTYLGAVIAPMDPVLARLGGCAAVALSAW